MRPLIDTPVTPNQLTTLRLAAGIAAAAALAVGDEAWRYAGAGIFVFSVVLDRADGELARLTGKTTPWGHSYDLVADLVSDVLIFIGLGLGLRDGGLGSWAVPLGVAAGASVAAIFWLVMRIESLEGARAAELKSYWGFDVDDAILLVPIAIWLGWSEPLLIAASIGAPVFAAFFFWMFRRRLRAAG